MAEEFLTLDKFYRQMGHISATIAQQLVKDKFVTGVQLKYTPLKDLKSFFCESCIYAKSTRKTVPEK